MHDLPVSVPAFHGRRRLHGLNVGAVDLKTFLFPTRPHLLESFLRESTAEHDHDLRHCCCAPLLCFPFVVVLFFGDAAA